jgi:hypothetical protein
MRVWSPGLKEELDDDLKDVNQLKDEHMEARDLRVLM